MTPKKWALLGSAVIILFVVWFALWPDQSAEQPTEPAEEEAHREGFVAITPEQIETSDIVVADVTLGAATEMVFPATVTARPEASAVIDARASGVVRSIAKTLGDHVREGETVARIESGEAASLASQLNSARARVKELSAAHAREENLFEANVTARQDLEGARANLAVARAELQRAQATVAAAGVSGDGRSLAVISPLAGRVTKAPITLGSFVSAGDELYHVVDQSALQVEVVIPSGDAAMIGPGDGATLMLPGGKEIAGRVRSITPAVDPKSRSATAVVAPSSPTPGLRPGAFLEVNIRPSGSVDPNRISLPEGAVQSMEGRDVVFRRAEGGFQVTPVTIGDRTGGRVTVLSGLKAGAPIAMENTFLLKAEMEKEGTSHGH